MAKTATKTEYDPTFEVRQGNVGILVYDAESPSGIIQLFNANNRPMYPTAGPLSAKQMLSLSKKLAKAGGILQRLEG